MWYVFYCPNLESEKMMRFCRQHFSQKALKEVFLFTYDRMRRYEGAWHMERQELFPNYIFWRVKMRTV